ncbi:MAG: hypothetical protein R3F59_26985 [Myxococcota bacterium]
MKTGSLPPAVLAQIRRFLLGIVVEVLHDEGIDVDLRRLEVAFGPDSGLRFAWFDNWMRFQGDVSAPLAAPLAAPLDSAGTARLQARFDAVWPEIIAAVGTLPLADRLDITRQEVTVDTRDGTLRIRFDLEAD